MDWSFLASAQEPRLHLWTGAPADLVDEPPPEPGPMLRWLRGSRMRTREGLMDEWAAAAQFPPYFGGTWDSLRDALADLPAGGVFLVLDADQVLQDAPPADFATLTAVLSEVAGDLAPQPFHLVLQAASAGKRALAGRLQALGAAFREV